MSEKLINLLLIKLKVTAALLIVAFISLLSFSFTTSRSFADDFWKQLGMTRDQGTDGVKQSFLNGYLYYYGAKNAKNIATGNRAAIAKDLLNYTKQYVNSEAFRKEYELMRRSAKPEEPQLKTFTKEDVRKEQIAETEKSIAKTEEIMKQPNMKAIMEPSLQLYKKNLLDYKDPNSKMIEMYYQGKKREQEQQMESYKKYYTRWENDYPADHREKIKERLQKFLELSATVDFNAELKQVGNKKKFVNPQYEGKAYDWKQVYRAGKEVIEPARAFAEQWIKELNSSIAKR
ncbi:MAG TPA: hypothetical protein VF476_19475 [Chitinophagaceae bacterium]